jgi:hypothetical protein
MKLLSEKGEVYVGDKFLSPRLVKEALGKKFNVSVMDEGSNYVKLRIIRFARLYGFPIVWPQASIEVWIDNKTDKLIYEFFWPEYLALLIPFILIPFVQERPREFTLFLVPATLFFGLLMFLDTRWVSRRVRRAFESIGPNSPITSASTQTG